MTTQAQYEARLNLINTVAQMAADGKFSDKQIVETLWKVYAKPEFADIGNQSLIELPMWDNVNLAIERQIAYLRTLPRATCEPKPITTDYTRNEVRALSVTTRNGYRISCALIDSKRSPHHIEIIVWAPNDGDIVEQSDWMYDLESAKSWRNAAYKQWSATS